MCYLVAHDKKQPAYKYEEVIIGDRLIPKNATTEALEALCCTLNIIDIWLKLSEGNYEVRSGMCHKDMKDMSKQIPTTMSKPLSPK